MNTIIIKPLRAISLLLITAVLFSTSLYAKKYYRFVNDEGQTILIDQLTPEAVNKGYDVINDQGQLVQSVPPAKTLGELQEEKQRQLEEKRKKREQQRQIRRDAELLRLFGSAEDIMRARDSALLGIEQRQELNTNDQQLLKASLEDLQRRAADYERLGKPIPHKLKDNITSTQKQIAERERNKAIIEQERETIVANFERDLIRFKELQAKRMAHKFKNNRDKSNQANMMVLSCNEAEYCKNIWQLAQVYAQTTASGRLEVVTDTIILTSAPKADTEIGIAFSKLPSKADTQIILEVSCNNTDAGEQLCASSEARKVVKGFQDFIDKQLR